MESSGMIPHFETSGIPLEDAAGALLVLSPIASAAPNSVSDAGSQATLPSGELEPSVTLAFPASESPSVCRSMKRITFITAALNSIQLISKSVVYVCRGSSCVQYSAVPSLEQENQTDRFRKARTSRTNLSKRLSDTSTAIEFTFAISREWRGRTRPRHGSRTSAALIRAPAAAGLRATTSHRQTFSARSSARSCAAIINGSE